MPQETQLLDRSASAEDDFALDVRVVVGYVSASRGDCPTDDGCGVTCATDASACNSNYDIPA
jgi:FxLD family lantipeptide